MVAAPDLWGAARGRQGGCDIATLDSMYDERLSSANGLGAIAVSLEAVSEKLEERMPNLIANYFAHLESDERMRSVLDASPLAGYLRRAVAAVFRDLVTRLRTGVGHPNELPPEATYLARRWAWMRRDLGMLMESFTCSEDTLWAEFERILDVEVASAETRWMLAKHGRAHLRRYSTRCAELLTRAWEAERTTLTGACHPGCGRWITTALAGHVPSGADHEYDLAGHHVALVAWGDDADAVVRRLGAVGYGRLARMTAPDGVVWGWLGTSEAPSREFSDELASRARTGGGKVAFGEPAQGLDGFRRTHDQALAARDYAFLRDHEVICYREVALVALARQCRSAAAAFKCEELGELASNDARARKLRTTLRVYLEQGQNAKVTAAVLGMHRETVRDHLLAAEDRLGYRTCDRAAELLLALRLLDLEERTRPPADESGGLLESATPDPPGLAIIG